MAEPASSALPSSFAADSPLAVDPDQLARLRTAQLALRQKLVTENRDLTFGTREDGSDPVASFPGLQLVGGVDISFLGEGFDTAVAGLVILTYPELKVVHTSFRKCRFDLPYIPGFLAFREAPVLDQMIAELRHTHPTLVPQVILVDGNGVLHPRGFGVACHLGVLADIPTVGVAKNYLHFNGGPALSIQDIRAHVDAASPHTTRELSLVGDTGRVWGMAMCLADTTRPIFISAGHRLDLATAVRLVRHCCRYRIPEPIRAADQLTRRYIRERSAEWGEPDNHQETDRC
ncbi:hypothetical protein IWQ60_009392 [Tieghemiomyces parasiticus]|uniref:Endonuclease V n=1 Tax=Tieghemiomyces parasiticus TaxID=78921 RepID=A0A9W7ZN70_9FUNG|nr:hypothetical protein IWQ60_009392 [Tieghemiomyces parasiticus]